MVAANWGNGSPWVSLVLLAFIVRLAALARPIYRSDADTRFKFSELWDEFFAGLMPPTILISFALGSILLGFATPAEAAAMGAFGAILLSLIYRKFTFYFLKFVTQKSTDVTLSNPKIN